MNKKKRKSASAIARKPSSSRLPLINQSINQSMNQSVHRSIRSLAQSEKVRSGKNGACGIFFFRFLGQFNPQMWQKRGPTYGRNGAILRICIYGREWVRVGGVEKPRGVDGTEGGRLAPNEWNRSITSSCGRRRGRTCAPRPPAWRAATPETTKARGGETKIKARDGKHTKKGESRLNKKKGFLRRRRRETVKKKKGRETVENKRREKKKMARGG